MRIRYLCHYSALTGFGRAARDYATALVAAGATVEIVDWRSYPGRPEAAADATERVGTPEHRYRALDALVRPWPTGNEDPAPDLVLAHGKPQVLADASIQDGLRTSAGTPIAAMTTWETSRLPEALARGLGRYDALIVPSTFVAEVFDDQFDQDALHPDVWVVPHTFDPTVWAPAAYGRVRTDGPTHFYTHGAWSERKHHLAVVRAFLHAFTADDDVDLMICSQGLDRAAVQTTILRGGLAPAQAPKMFLHGDPLSEANVLELHATGDVFVTATRGEGWGLPIFEAAVMGKPIIAPRYGGQADFLQVDTFPDPDAGWVYSGWRPVDHVMVPCFAGEPTLVTDAAGRPIGLRASAVLGMDCKQTWAAPSISELADRMRAIHAQRQAGYVTINASDREVLERRFAYATVGPDLLRVLKEIASS